ncbi:MAG TPA: tRNA (adenosine(37)-N6)-threonylcarbamoyltransferase complex transferase subunit TsaD [Candidatus Paceibacterota bacterium]|nr:tRNA (adenosine(37)-N6)-threonylcarbamoyltransferase complex transferase subunit TsaD [Candidatus Paceibacterota bacterium]
MVILGIETSCDETAVAVVEATDGGFTVRSSVVSSQIAMHEKFGGVVPALAAREHAANIEHVFNTALKEAGITDPVRDIDLIAVTRGPGLGPALLVGLMFARTLAWKWSKPLVGVNHLDGHIHSNWLGSTPPPDVFPALNVIVSGGHTELVLMRDHGAYEIVGETQDDAVGEAFDKVARLLDLGYPGGPKISKLALDGDPTAYDLPRPMLKSADFNFSYSGLKTAVLYLVRDLGGELTDKQKADIAASFQEAAVDVLIRKTRRAAQELDVNSLMLSGGVSANALLRERLQELGMKLGLPVFIPDVVWTGDNAAMIAVAGCFAAQKEKTASTWETVMMDANLRLDA